MKRGSGCCAVDIYWTAASTSFSDSISYITYLFSEWRIDTDITTQEELEELAVTLCVKLMKAVETSTNKTYSHNDSKSPVSQDVLNLIEERRKLRQLYSTTQDPNTKSTINEFQKEVRTKINQESTISWERFCNSIILESDPRNQGIR